MQSFSRLNKIFWRVLFTKMSLLLLIVGFCLLLTIFACAVLVMDYYWSMLDAAIVCLIPWLIIIFILYILYQLDHKKYKREKHALLENGRMAIISRVITLGIQYFLARWKKTDER